MGGLHFIAVDPNPNDGRESEQRHMNEHLRTCVRPQRELFSPEFGLIELDSLITGDPHSCSYLPDKEASEEYFGTLDLEPELYHDFMNAGFRRSGYSIYRPACEECSECRPIRILADRFEITKSCRRVMKKNQDVLLNIQEPGVTEDKIALYNEYQRFQHGTRHESSMWEVENFLYQSPVQTLELEYRIQDKIVCISIVDICSRSLSGVYTYFDPEYADRSLGTYSAIREILLCRDRGIPFYYLGFHVADCPSMSYKARFKPYQILSPKGIWH